ncbi:MAG: anti-sigma factor family protein [Blastocatellia bacterium]
MNGNCLEIGMIQAFLDGETPSEISLKVTEHISACDACALSLAEAEEQNSLVFSALERELNTLVPTHRLWSRINESIEVEKGRAPFWQQIYAFFASQLASPSLTAAAGVLVVFALVAAVWSLRSGVQVPVDTAVSTQTIMTSSNPQPDSINLVTNTGLADDNSPALAPKFVNGSNFPPEKVKKLVDDANKQRNDIRPQYLLDTSLPGEESYIKTIADLNQNIDGQKDTVLTPATRVAFERDMAVVDDAITKMKKVVRKNPRNQAARQILYSSYQDKIDLLNSVAQREELLVSMR